MRTSKGLEVVVAAQLSGCPVLRQEILDGVDIHEVNRDTFNLGEGKAGRLVAKIFKFRLIYGGQAYSYANDPAFMGVSAKKDFWQNVIDEYYRKYYGMANWHASIMDESQRNGRLTIPSGRYYPFTFEPDRKGNMKWPATKVKNYPVQGFGADLVKLARLEAYKRLKASEIEAKLVSTIHDSIVVDCPTQNVPQVCRILKDSVDFVPTLCYNIWSYDFSLPLTCEVQTGMNKKEMEAYVF